MLPINFRRVHEAIASAQIIGSLSRVSEGIFPKADLFYENLTQVRFRHCDLRKADLRGAATHPNTFTDCLLDKALRLPTDVKIPGWRLEHGKLERAPKIVVVDVEMLDKPLPPCACLNLGNGLICVPPGELSRIPMEELRAQMDQDAARVILLLPRRDVAFTRIYVCNPHNDKYIGDRIHESLQRRDIDVWQLMEEVRAKVYVHGNTGECDRSFGCRVLSGNRQMIIEAIHEALTAS
jgi:hypothetical protein